MIKLLANGLRTLCNRAIKGGLVKVEELVQVMYLWDYKRKKKIVRKNKKLVMTAVMILLSRSLI